MRKRKRLGGGFGFMSHMQFKTSKTLTGFRLLFFFSLGIFFAIKWASLELDIDLGC